MHTSSDNDCPGALAGVLRGIDGSPAWAREQLAGTGAVAELEKKFAEYYGMAYALCVSSATSGLLAVALALGLRGREFITTPYTYGATLAGWLLMGNRPVFVDVDPRTLTLDPAAVRRAISAKTAAILAVDVDGTPSDDSGLRQVADEFGVPYVADAAQSVGGRRAGRPASSLADAVVVSLGVGKSISVGEGGIVLTNDRALYEKLLDSTQHPSRQGRELGFDRRNEFGLNSRIHPVAAIWAAAGFEASLNRVRVHQERCSRAVIALDEIGFTEPFDLESREILPSFFRLTAAWNGLPRPSELLGQLSERGIGAVLAPVTTELVFRQSAFRRQFRGRYRVPEDCIIADDQARRRFCVHVI